MIVENFLQKRKNKIRQITHIDNFSTISFNKDVITSTTNNKHLGFTLIELLIVIGVIGILAASILIIINPFGQFAKARDAGRKQTLKQLANALEGYMIKNGSYPITGVSV